MKLSLSGRMFEKDYRDCALPMADFVALAKDIGYQGVELRKTQVSLDTPAPEVTRIGRMLEKAGIAVTCLTTRGILLETQEHFSLFEKYVDLAKTLACRLIKTGGDIPWLQRAADHAAEHGITLASNTHIKTPFETVSSASERLRAIGRKNFRLIYDPANLFMAGEDYGATAIEALADSIAYVTVQCPQRTRQTQGEHLIHYKGFSYQHGLPGQEGTPDFSSVFTGLRQIGYDGWISVVEPKRAGMSSQKLARLFHESASRLMR
ncbi:MAG: sugar phosphate isomerase/epimerase family protein [Candidatus Latescibacterota bacterium]